MSDPTEVQRHQGGEDRLCVVCSDPVDPATEHWPHKPDCPTQRGEDRCTCNYVAHPDCCPECHPPREEVSS